MLDIKKNISFEVRSEIDIPETTLLELKHLADSEQARLFALRKCGKTTSLDQRTAIISTLTHAVAVRRIASHLPTKFIFARDQGNELIGYSITSLPSEVAQEAELAFLGVRSSCLHQGIGTSLLEKTHKTLRELGVTKYTMDAQTDLVRIVEKFGMYFIASMHPTSSTARHVQVFLSSIR